MQQQQHQPGEAEGIARGFDYPISTYRTKQYTSRTKVRQMREYFFYVFPHKLNVFLNQKWRKTLSTKQLESVVKQSILILLPGGFSYNYRTK